MAANTTTDNRDYCMVCAKEIPPGGHCCSPECDAVFAQILAGQAPSSGGVNPKDLVGNKKVSVTKLPAVGILHGAHAMMNGAAKYGPYNWRTRSVISSIYVDAIMRHLMAWFDQSEEVASDSGVHHLGHVIASASILLDAQATGNLVDDRPIKGKGADVLQRLNHTIAELTPREKGA